MRSQSKCSSQTFVVIRLLRFISSLECKKCQYQGYKIRTAALKLPIERKRVESVFNNIIKYGLSLCL